MSEQISTDNTKKILLEGNGQKAAPRPSPIPPSRKQRADVVVENAAEKRYLWTARAFAVIFAISICCNVILTFTIMNTIPLYRIEPYLLSFADKNEQIYHVEPVRKLKDYKYLTELFVREYLILRNSFTADVDEMKQRWGADGDVREMSSPRIYSDFKKEFADAALELIRQYGVTRDIKILSITEVAGGKEGQVWWQVEFRASDMAPTYETPRISEWVANIGIRYITKKVTYGKRLKNPIGFTVTHYQYEQRKKM